MAEGRETPGGESRAAAEAGGTGAEGDLLAERRARRAAESGETALVRRAEAAEATVRTLESHVASLEQRLRGVEEERRRMGELVEAEKAALGDRSLTEQELRRAKQREYAEQRLRVEAEDRRTDVERESRGEIDRLTRRLGAGEQRARELTRQLERAQRRLAEAEQSAATEIAAARRAEHAFQTRLTDLEGRALEIQRGLEAERAARQGSDRLLQRMREGHRRVEALVGELGELVGRLYTAAARSGQAVAEPGESRPAGPAATERPPRLYTGPVQRAKPAPGGEGGNEQADRREMTEALAAAVERLRARAEDVADGSAQAPPQGDFPEPVQPARPVAAPPRAPAHKHSMSLLTRLKIRRKERRRRRAAAGEPPSMQSQ